MLHFLLALFALVGYVILRLYNIDDETMKLVLMAVTAYFFGSSGLSIMKDKNNSNNGSGN